MQAGPSSSQSMKLVKALEPQWAGFITEDVDQNRDEESDGESDRPNEESNNREEDSDSDSDEESDEDDSSVIAYDESTQNGRFFTLPCEVRLMVYGYLLRANGMIINKNRSKDTGYIPLVKEQDLHPQILATCRQINSEAHNMLFDENIFQVRIADYDRHFHQCRYKCELSFNIRPPPIFQRMKRIELKVGGGRYIHHLLDSVQTTGRVLAQMPELEYVSIKISEGIGKIVERDVDRDFDGVFSKAAVHRSILQGLTMIRNVRHASVEGVPPDWEEYLVEKMTSSSSLPTMYYALESYARPFGTAKFELPEDYYAAGRRVFKFLWKRRESILWVNNALEKAYRAAGRDNLKKFLAERKRVIESVNDYMNHATNHVFDDPSFLQRLEDCKQSRDRRRYWPIR